MIFYAWIPATPPPYLSKPIQPKKKSFFDCAPAGPMIASRRRDNNKAARLTFPLGFGFFPGIIDRAASFFAYLPPTATGIASQTCRQPGKFHLLGNPAHWPGFTSWMRQELPSSIMHSWFSFSINESPLRFIRNRV